MNWLWQSLYHAAAMLWETLWALALGFSLSAFLQVFLRNEQITKRFGKTNLRSVGLATFFGAVSSSCSCAAAAILKLQKEGKVSVNDKLSKYIPDFPRGDEVTLRQLLAHTSG
ncbi:MAG: permease, partial [Limisphaerales bacterium]